MSTLTAAGRAPRSNFVTVLAWFGIALFGFMSLISALQNVMIHTIMPLNQLRNPAMRPGGLPMPGFASFMLDHLETMMLAMLVFALVMLLTSVCLLRRQNWARLVFAGVLGLGILWNLAAPLLQNAVIAAQRAMLSDMRSSVADENFAANFDRMLLAMQIAGVVFAIALSVLFAWLIKRLLSATIRAEFVKSP